VVPHVRHEGGVRASSLLQQRAQTDADQRREISAADLRRLIDRAVLGRQTRQRRARPQRLEPLVDVGVRPGRQRGEIRALRALEIVRPFEQVADLHERR
jgi:hypothetical protein